MDNTPFSDRNLPYFISEHSAEHFHITGHIRIPYTRLRFDYNIILTPTRPVKHFTPKTLFNFAVFFDEEQILSCLSGAHIEQAGFFCLSVSIQDYAEMLQLG
jgi:hypothetical protein